MFLRNKNIIFKIRRSKVTDYAALMVRKSMKDSMVLKTPVKAKAYVILTSLNYVHFCARYC